MNKVIEKVARAICSDSIPAKYSGTPGYIDERVDDYTEAARAAIQALIDAADKGDDGHGCAFCGQNHPAIAREWLKQTLEEK